PAASDAGNAAPYDAGARSTPEVVPDTRVHAARRAAMASREAIQSAVAAYFGAVRAMDANGFADTFAPDGVTHDPVGTPPQHGRDAIRQFLQGFFDAYTR